MRVIYFHQYFSTPAGASGTRSYEMAKRLIDRGHQVLMVCGSAARAETGVSGPFVRGSRRGMVRGIEVVEFDLSYSNNDGFLKRTLSFLTFAVRSLRLVLVEQYDVIFATTTPLTAGIPGIVGRWFRAKPFVFEVRDLWPELPRAMGVIRNPLVLGGMSVLEWVSYRSATRLVGLSPGIVEGILRRGVPRRRVVMIPNGCDFDIFAAQVESWRPPEVTSTDLMAVFTGAHGIANGLDAVLDAASELQQRQRPDIKIVFVGDGKLKPHLQLRARREGLTSVVFHDPVSKQRLAGLLAAADLGLQILDNVPAFYDGTSPNKFFDYMASGLPVLINYPGWLAESVGSWRCGYAVVPGDPIAFADALVHAADHRGMLPAMGARARQLAEAEFDRRVLSAQLVDWVEGAVAS